MAAAAAASSSSASDAKSNYTCLPAGFSFQSYTPLDPQIPSAATAQQQQHPSEFVRNAMESLPDFDRDVPPAEKRPIATVDEGVRVLAKAKAERKVVADLERCIADQIEVSRAMTERAVSALKK